MNARRGWFALFVSVVFLSGLGSGLLVSRQLDQPAAASSPGHRGQGGRRGSGPPPAEIARRMAGDLELTADQQEKVENVLTARRERLDQLRAEVRTRFDAEHEGLRAEVEALLTPAQRQQYDTMLSNMRKRKRSN
jgi:Spy/CpxP family protein refolding chaperone